VHHIDRGGALSFNSQLLFYPPAPSHLKKHGLHGYTPNPNPNPNPPNHLPDHNARIRPPSRHQGLVPAPAAERPHPIVMRVKGAGALAGLEGPELEQAVGA